MSRFFGAREEYDGIDADHADAKKPIEKLIGSGDPNDRARMLAQARLVEACERSEWPRTASRVSLPARIHDLYTARRDAIIANG